MNAHDDVIRDVLTSVKRIALVGASHKPERPSFGVMRRLLDHGYEVVPVNPGLVGQRIHGQPVVARLDEVPGSIDMVEIFRRSEEIGPIIDDAIRLRIPVVWTQLGVVDETAAARARTAGLTVVMDRCPAIEIPRLGIERR